MTTLGEALARATATLKAAGIESARVDARVLAAHVLGFSLTEVPSPRLALTQIQAAALDAAVARRATGEPVAYITGHKEFFGLDFDVGSGVLIPRPESETLVEEALKDFPAQSEPFRILDLGAGSGCLLIAFLANRPAALGIGFDQSAEAINWCQRNVLRHHLETRCELRLGNWAESANGQFEVIFSNPPYVPSGEIAHLAVDVRSFEPICALDGGPDGLGAFRSLGPILTARLAPTGRAYLEVGQGQHHMVSGIMESAGLEVARVVSDLAGILRCVVLRRPGKPC